MAMSGTVLGTTLKADIKSQLLSLFPVNTGLLSAEQSQLNTCIDNLAKAIATPTGTDVVAHITALASVIVTSVTGVTTGPGVSGPGTGTVA